jgi:ABC-type multidrug transport system fused ATPase/permease subunit
VEKFISTAVNLVFTTLIGLVFVMIYASQVHWSVAPAYLLTVPLLGGLSSVLSRKIKAVQKRIVQETTALAGATTESLRNIELVKSLGLAQQEIARLNATTGKDPQAGAAESALSPQPQLRAGHVRQPAAHVDSLPHALSDLHAADQRGTVLLALYLFVLHLRTAAGTRERDQRLS